MTNGYYVQAVKLLKAWRDRLPTEKSKPKSYILETLVHQTIGLPPSHARAVVNVLESIQTSYGPYRGTGIVPQIPDRSEERSVGKECVSTCNSRWSPYP